MDAMQYIAPQEWDLISEPDRQRIAVAVSRDRTSAPREVGEVRARDTFYTRYGKRFLDVVIGGLALLVTAPINLVLAIATRIDVGRPLLFKQQRIGLNGEPFDLVKFRNMTNATNENGVLLPPDQRVTKWGRFVRKTSLDELLNLWSIVKGDMSIIGPRPLPVKYRVRFSDRHRQRERVRPGLECPFHDKSLAAQGWSGRFENDIWYVENVSFATDVKMIFLLVKKVFSKKEREESATGKIGEFIGYRADGGIMEEDGIPRKYLSVLNERRAG